ncbi:MAG: glutamine--fructose-6-phosphate transaminase (isomerizing) [Oscillospiraceae bacterium]|jgi:glucosamine--fructose-6-phosphate aminotransferase (isomerizing)|nr:glutamine--fructose-6-phosphate transaminase (isomerizing) [Oscillospiraceae bacterium]
MCGIIGYSGHENAADKLIHALTSLEYRGYDSAGVTLFAENGTVTLKKQGRLKNLQQLLADNPIASVCGIGHTRWATHGKPSDDNAHPHVSGKVSLVHNGIIENYADIRRDLERDGAVFLSDTDTESAVKLLDDAYRQTGEPLSAIRQTCEQLTGSYAFAIVFADINGKVFGVRRGSPLIAAYGQDGNFVASDITAVLWDTRRYISLDENEIAAVTNDGIVVTDFDGKAVAKETKTAEWDSESAEKGGFPHFMLKEIHEEAESVGRTVAAHIKDGLPDFQSCGLSRQFLSKLKSVTIAACGTAMHAGLVGKTVTERLAGIPVRVEVASEFRYGSVFLEEGDLFVAVSQSGETADTLAALDIAKQHGARTLGIVNAAGSALSREADGVFLTMAGPEISVASTKAYGVQLAALYLLAIATAEAKGKLSSEDARLFTQTLLTEIPSKISEVVSRESEIRTLASDFMNAKSVFFIGRGLDCALSYEGSLKLKEISYIHSESYAAGEMKHGTISLIEENTPVVAVATQPELFTKTISNIREVKARGANVLLICPANFPNADIADTVFNIPATSELFTPFTAVTALQLFAYHMAELRGRDIDKPRNLAKSVTVE